MGRSFMEVCRFVGCLPSELYQKHNPTIGDYLAISAYWQVLADEETRKINAIMGAGKT